MGFTLANILFKGKYCPFCSLGRDMHKVELKLGQFGFHPGQFEILELSNFLNVKDEIKIRA